MQTTRTPPMPPVRSAKSLKLKSDRSRIDLSDDAIARQWTKKLGRSRDDIEAAIEKVGDNCETVRKELGAQGEVCASPAERSPAARSPSTGVMARRW